MGEDDEIVIVGIEDINEGLKDIADILKGIRNELRAISITMDKK